MLPVKIRTISTLFTIMLLAAGASFGFVYDDDEIPEVTDRVARISDLSGDVQIKRSDSEEWEKAVLNLPVVEGDEISAGPGARYEVQLASHKHIRVSENSYLRVVVINDQGVALSLSEGMMTARLLEFDAEAEFFEIDLPKATVAMQLAGRYRVDAGGGEFNGVSVSISEGGEARVYSTTSGFTLKDGRTARVFTDGRNEGEWELSDFAGLNDEFDSWSLDRERQVAQLLNNARYDEYYDREIYGAEDLNNYGDWVHTYDYGYVWQPSGMATRSFSDWSPYRYGQWRWLPSFGWTWVNDEPWGWATYHHGRWFWYNGRWVWSPYGYYRTSRSWWRPALVVMTVYNNNICWYPLGYNSRYYNFNRRHQQEYRRGNRRPQQPTPVTPMPTPDPNAQRRARNNAPSLERGPMTGVISVPRGQFGRSSRSITRLPDVTAREVIDKEPVIVNSPPLLPTRREIGDDVSKDIRPDKPRVAKPAVDAKRTGAATRTEKAPLDEKLKNSRMYGNRPPLQTTPAQTTRDTGVGQPQTQRRTGAVERKENTRTRPEVTGETPPIAAPLPKTTPSTRPRTETKSTQPSTSPGNTPPIAAPRSRTSTPSKPSTPPAQTQPRSSTPRATPQPRSTPSQPKATPSKPSTPPAQTQPRSSTPRATPQPRSTPSQPKATPSKPSTPPARSQPKPSQSKPSAPSKSNDSSRPAPSKSKKP